MDDLKHPMPLGYIHGVPRRCQRCPLAGVGCSSGPRGPKEAAGHTGASDPSGSWSSICRWVPLIANSPWSWREGDMWGEHSLHQGHFTTAALKTRAKHTWRQTGALLAKPRLGRTTMLYNGLERYMYSLLSEALWTAQENNKAYIIPI